MWLDWASLKNPPYGNGGCISLSKGCYPTPVLFDGTGAWTQRFVFTKQVLYHLSHTSSPFCSGYFGDGVLQTICPGWPWTVTLLILASQRETGTWQRLLFLRNWDLFWKEKESGTELLVLVQGLYFTSPAKTIPGHAQLSWGRKSGQLWETRENLTLSTAEAWVGDAVVVTRNDSSACG
jgi:hypothetical protein